MQNLYMIFAQDTAWVVLISKGTFGSVEAIMLASGDIVCKFSYVNYCCT